jgi:branched-chain amino acid transport system ATP-binding protein
VKPILELRRVDAAYGSKQILKAVDLTVEEYGITTLLGANGAGKTTTLRAICNMIPRVSGEIWFAGKRIDRKATEEIARLGIAHVPDGRGTFVDLTVEENLRIGAYTRRDKGLAADLERMYTYFPRLKERRRQQAGKLSGGEQQMLAISRALMLQPTLLLLDEPSFGLAPLAVQEIFQMLRTINQDGSVAMLLVEQNASIALELADRAYLIETGCVITGGPAAIIARDDAVRRAYLGY